LIYPSQALLRGVGVASADMEESQVACGKSLTLYPTGFGRFYASSLGLVTGALQVSLP